jgi:hypothetical protein
MRNKYSIRDVLWETSMVASIFGVVTNALGVRNVNESFIVQPNVPGTIISALTALSILSYASWKQW